MIVYSSQFSACSMVNRLLIDSIRSMLWDVTNAEQLILAVKVGKSEAV